MAFTNTWDETAPDGSTTPANTIDTIFQDLKVDIRERIENAFPNWDTETDETALIPSGIINADTHANRPTSPYYPGQWYYETDTEQLFMGVGGSWVQLGITGALGAGPSRVQVKKTSTQSLGDATVETISWDATEFESDPDLWDGASPEDIAIQEDGLYLITLNTFLESAGGASYRCQISVDGGTTGPYGNVSKDGSYASVSALVALTTSNVVQGVVYQDSGGAVNLAAGTIMTVFRMA